MLETLEMLFALSPLILGSLDGLKPVDRIANEKNTHILILQALNEKHTVVLFFEFELIFLCYFF